MRFLTKRTTNPNDIHCSHGSRYKKVYSPLFDGKKLILVESGVVDVQEEINSHSMECDINYILSRLSKGDMSVLNGQKPIYADFKNLPAGFRDAFDVAFNAERTFATLPSDIRAKFDNDYRQFIYSIGTPEFNSIMGFDSSGPSSGTPSSGTPSSGTPSSGTPSSGTPSSVKD